MPDSDDSISQEDISELLSSVETEEEKKEKTQKINKKQEHSNNTFNGINLEDLEQETKTTSSPKIKQPSVLTTGKSSENIENMSLLLDVKMDLSVEIGRSKMRIDEILSLGTGTIVELDKLNGEFIDITVNNKLIARGEIVAIDGNFGVKIASIVDVAERLKFEL